MRLVDASGVEVIDSAHCLRLLVTQHRGLGVRAWAKGDRSHWVRPVPTRVTGRRVGKEWEA